MSYLTFIPVLTVLFLGKSPKSKEVKEIADGEKQKITIRLKELDKEISNNKIKDINARMIKLLEEKGELNIKKLWEIRTELINTETKTADESSQRLEILKAIYPAISKYVFKSSENVLKYEESGDEKYPEKHSFFSLSLQEATTDLSRVTIPGVDDPDIEDIEKFCKNFKGKYNDIRGLAKHIQDLCSAIEEADTIEKALIAVEEKFDGNYFSPNAFTHRLSKDSTYDKKNVDFEVLFITGSKGPLDNKIEFIFESYMLENAINRKHGGKGLKSTTRLNEPDEATLIKSIQEISVRCKKENRKLYIFYCGHGNAGEKVQKGAKEEARDKQGALNYRFHLKTIGENDKTGLFDNNILGDKYINIKSLYNKYLSDVETVTVFSTCHGGAGIAFNFLKRLGVIYKA